MIQTYANLEYIHEFRDKPRTITAFFRNDSQASDDAFAIRLLTDAPDKDFGVVSAGVTWLLRGGTQYFIHVDSVQGLSDVDKENITAGVRLEF